MKRPHGKRFAIGLLACLMPVIALTAMGDEGKVPTIKPGTSMGLYANEDDPPVGGERRVEVIGPDINQWLGRENCFEVVFSLKSTVASTNVWVDFTAYASDNLPLYVGDSISFDECATYTNEIVVAVNGEGESGEIKFVWDAGRCGSADSVHHTVLAARFPDEDVMVACRNGRFVGLRHSETKVVSFKSVPFAAPARRWLPPEPPADSEEIVSARRFGPAAAQTFEPSEYASRGPVSEDCLKLSIWTADGFDPKKPDRAVMFYIHGGSYVLGGMCDPLYDGSNIVKDNPEVIVVSCDYRLCAFGYLDLTGLPGFDPVRHAAYAQAPNLGILDLQAGLRWVQQNIGYFGGDANKVTIFGESAGGGSVSCLLQAKGSEGLFQRAIVMSGTVDLTDSVDLYKGSNQALLLLKAAGKDNFEELLDCTTDELIAALNVPLTDPRLVGIPHIAPREGGPNVADMNNRPMCDDVRGIVPSDPFAAFATNGIAKDVDVMIGSTSEELNYWAYLMYDYDGGNKDHPLDYYYSFLSNGVRRTQSIYTELGYGGNVQEFLRDIATAHPFDSVPEYTYNGRYPEIWGRTELRSELAFRMPSIIMAEQHLKQVANLGGAGRTYMYYFCRPQVNPTMPWVGACHGSELATVFKNLHLEVDGTNRVELANRFNGAFVNFAKYGDPNGQPSEERGGEIEEGVDYWKTYDTTSRNTMVVGEIGNFTNSTLRLVSDPKKRQRELLEPGYLGYHAKIANGLEAPAGTAENPWTLGASADDTVVAWTNGAGKVFFAGSGAMRDLYAVDGVLWFGATTTAAEIGADVTSIGAMALSTCSGLTSIVMRSSVPPTLGEDALPPVEQLEAVHVPQNCVGAYRDAWPEYADAIKPYCADTVVYGTIRTAEEGNPVAEAIVVKDGRYVYVGGEAGAAAFVKDGVTEVVDHRGKGMVMPGCTDGHSHYLNTFAMGGMKGGVLFSADDDKAAVLQKLSEAAQKAKDAKKTSLCGFGWNLANLKNDRPTLTDLDPVTYGVSTVIFDSSGHNAFCNSECLKRCGIIDGKGGVLIREIDGGLLELDKDGYPTGYVNERVTGYLTRMGGIDADELIDGEVAEDAIRRSQELLLSTGYTTALDGWSNNLHPRKFYEVAHCMDTNGTLKLVLPMTYEVEPWQTNIAEQVDYLASLDKDYRTRHVRPEYLKVFMDGVVEAKTGAILKPYKDGMVCKSFWAVDRLADITKMCNARGLTVHTHTMGDAAIRDTVDAYIRGGDGTRRNCLVHLRNLHKEDFRRIANNNIACTAGLTWHAGDEWQSKYLSGFLDDEYVSHAYPMKSFFDAGVKVSSHSDYPANMPCPQDPFGMMHVAVIGMLPIPDEGDRPYDTGELITVEQAFRALTINGAWQVGLENERGSIKVGKWADFVLASKDVFTCPVTDIGKTKVVSTWFEGEKVYEAPSGSEANPWAVGVEGHEAEMTAWTNGMGTLVVEGAGALGSMPWAEKPEGITKLVKAEGVTGLDGLVCSLPCLKTVNGFTREDFGSAVLGFVRAEGFSAIAVENGKATLDVVIGRSDSLGESAEWQPVSTNAVEVPAPGEKGFFIIAPQAPEVEADRLSYVRPWRGPVE